MQIQFDAVHGTLTAQEVKNALVRELLKKKGIHISSGEADVVVTVHQDLSATILVHNIKQ